MAPPPPSGSSNADSLTDAEDPDEGFKSLLSDISLPDEMDLDVECLRCVQGSRVGGAGAAGGRMAPLCGNGRSVWGQPWPKASLNCSVLVRVCGLRSLLEGLVDDDDTPAPVEEGAKGEGPKGKGEEEEPQAAAAAV
jgi:hypothetical protein